MSGGQLNQIYSPIKNFPGIAEIQPARLSKAMFDQAVSSSLVTHITGDVVHIDPKTPGLTLADKSVIHARYIIAATGVRRRKLGIPGEDEFAGKGVLDSGMRRRQALRDKTIVIVGGGDAAVENAALIGEFAKKIYLIHRGENLRARSEIIAAAQHRDNIEYLFETTLTAIDGEDSIRSVRLTTKTGENHDLPTDALLIRIGVQPNTELFRDIISLDDDGYFVVDGNCRTSSNKIFAIGDASFPLSPTIPTAIGSGSTTAKVLKMSLLDEIID